MARVCVQCRQYEGWLDVAVAQRKHLRTVVLKKILRIPMDHLSGGSRDMLI